MFAKLKECKSIKEIYEVLGREPFEKVAAVLLVLWSALPLPSIITHVMWAGKNVEGYVYRFHMLSKYQTTVMFMGLLTIQFVLVYGLGLILWNKDHARQRIVDFFKKEPWNIFFIVLLIWSGICTLCSKDIHTSFFGTEYRYDGLLTYFYYAAVYMCAHIIKDERRRKKIFGSYAIVSVIMGICLLLQDYGVIDGVFRSQRATVFNQFNHMGYYLNMSVLVMTGLYLMEENIKLKILYAAGMTFQLFCLLVNNTFGGYLGTVAGVIGVCIIYAVNTHKIKRIIVPMVILVVLSLMSTAGLVPSSGGQNIGKDILKLFHDVHSIATEADDMDEAGTGRMILWKACFKMIPESPVVGYGPEQLNDKYSGAMLPWTDRPANEYIQHMVFLGIPGLLLYLDSLITMLVCQLKRIRKLTPTTIAAAGCVIAYAVCAFTGNTMFYTTPYMFMFLGLAAKNVHNYNSERLKG